MRHILRIIVIIACILPGTAVAAPAVPDDAVLPGGSQPLGPWNGVAPLPADASPDPAWSIRTGGRKGITDLLLPEERAAAPDAVVLRSGFFAPWRGLLAGFQEASELVEPDDLAGLAATKPLLIIPSGGLSGLAGSAFFRAGLAEYVSAGGVVLCFSQQKGADLAALPVPAGQSLDAAGWSEDGGPLYRASAVRSWHPVLSGITGTVPAVETDGSFRAVPAGGAVLLARSDGRATLLLYPYGRGHVALSSFASDVSHLQGLLANDERAIVRNLVRWAKAGGSLTTVVPGQKLDTALLVRRPDRVAAQAVRFTILDADRIPARQSQAETPLPPSLATAGTGTVPFQFWVPMDTPPGIFSIDYLLTDGKKHGVAPAAEAGGGWFALVPQALPSIAPSPDGAPLPPSPVEITADAVITRADDGRERLSLTVLRTLGTSSHELLVRTGGREQRIVLDGDRTAVSLALPASPAGQQAAFAVHHGGGRTLVRGSAAAAAASKTGITTDRSWYAAGQTVRVSVTGMGLGAVTVTGPGTELNQHISANRTFELPLPPTLPGGVYPLAWEFQTRTGIRQEGTLPIAVSGVAARITDAQFRTVPGGGEAVLTLYATGAVPASLTVRLAGPDHAALPAVERSLVLAPGPQTVTVPLTFAPAKAGIWQLFYAVTTSLPDGPGFPRGPLSLAAGRLLVDVGTTAVLGIRTARPLYYDPADGAGGTVYLHSSVKTSAEVTVDGKRQTKEDLVRPGTAVLPFSLQGLDRGRHRVLATASGSPAAERELTLLYGARLPDLAVSIKSADPVSPSVEIGVGIMNQGRAASGHASASLYEGDPRAGGTLVQTFTVPPLDPGRSFVAVVPVTLAGRTGSRPLTAVIDGEGKLLETNEENNRASLTLQVPELLVGIIPKKDSFQAGEPLGYLLRLVNFSASVYRPLTIEIQVTDPAGRASAPVTVSVPELAPGGETALDRTLDLPAPKEGAFQVRATGRAENATASDMAYIIIEPTLLLTGSLEGTPATASPCMPFTVRYTALSSGTMKPQTGSLKLEVRPRTGGQPVLTRPLPFVLGPGRVTIDRVDLPRGAYSLLLRGSAASGAVTRDFLLADLPVTVAGPVEVQRSQDAFPRVLLWTGGEDSTAITRALAEKLYNEAFADEEMLLKVVASANDFSNHALTGLYNTYVLFEINGLLDTVDVLKQGLERGHGIVLVGSDNYARTVAEGLGFRFTALPPAESEGLTFPAGSGLGVTGTVPLAGAALLPEKKNSRALAQYPDGRPALLLDPSSGGKVLALPFSLVRSALHTGASSLYSLVLRSAVQAAAPEAPEAGLVPVRITYVAPAGSAKARIVETLPAGAELQWSSVKPARKGPVLTFDVTAGPDTASILYLFRPPAGGERASSTEVFHQCDGKYVSQGKIE